MALMNNAPQSPEKKTKILSSCLGSQYSVTGFTNFPRFHSPLSAGKKVDIAVKDLYPKQYKSDFMLPTRGTVINSKSTASEHVYIDDDLLPVLSSEKNNNKLDSLKISSVLEKLFGNRSDISLFLLDKNDANELKNNIYPNNIRMCNKLDEFCKNAKSNILYLGFVDEKIQYYNKSKMQSNGDETKPTNLACKGFEQNLSNQYKSHAERQNNNKLSFQNQNKTINFTDNMKNILNFRIDRCKQNSNSNNYDTDKQKVDLAEVSSMTSNCSEVYVIFAKDNNILESPRMENDFKKSLNTNDLSRGSSADTVIANNVSNISRVKFSPYLSLKKHNDKNSVDYETNDSFEPYKSRQIDTIGTVKYNCLYPRITIEMDCKNEKLQVNRSFENDDKATQKGKKFRFANNDTNFILNDTSKSNSPCNFETDQMKTKSSSSFSNATKVKFVNPYTGEIEIMNMNENLDPQNIYKLRGPLIENHSFDCFEQRPDYIEKSVADKFYTETSSQTQTDFLSVNINVNDTGTYIDFDCDNIGVNKTIPPQNPMKKCSTLNKLVFAVKKTELRIKDPTPQITKNDQVDNNYFIGMQDSFAEIKKDNSHLTYVSREDKSSQVNFQDFTNASQKNNRCQKSCFSSNRHNPDLVDQTTNTNNSIGVQTTTLLNSISKKSTESFRNPSGSIVCIADGMDLYKNNAPEPPPRKHQRIRFSQSKTGFNETVAPPEIAPRDKNYVNYFKPVSCGNQCDSFAETQTWELPNYKQTCYVPPCQMTLCNVPSCQMTLRDIPPCQIPACGLISYETPPCEFSLSHILPYELPPIPIRKREKKITSEVEKRSEEKKLKSKSHCFSKSHLAHQQNSCVEKRKSSICRLLSKDATPKNATISSSNSNSALSGVSIEVIVPKCGFVVTDKTRGQYSHIKLIGGNSDDTIPRGKPLPWQTCPGDKTDSIVNFGTYNKDTFKEGTRNIEKFKKTFYFPIEQEDYPVKGHKKCKCCRSSYLNNDNKKLKRNVSQNNDDNNMIKIDTRFTKLTSGKNICDCSEEPINGISKEKNEVKPEKKHDTCKKCYYKKQPNFSSKPDEIGKSDSVDDYREIILKGKCLCCGTRPMEENNIKNKTSFEPVSCSENKELKTSSPNITCICPKEPRTNKVAEKTEEPNVERLIIICDDYLNEDTSICNNQCELRKNPQQNESKPVRKNTRNLKIPENETASNTECVSINKFNGVINKFHNNKTCLNKEELLEVLTGILDKLSNPEIKEDIKESHILKENYTSTAAINETSNILECECYTKQLAINEGKKITFCRKQTDYDDEPEGDIVVCKKNKIKNVEVCGEKLKMKKKYKIKNKVSEACEQRQKNKIVRAHGCDTKSGPSVKKNSILRSLAARLFDEDCGRRLQNSTDGSDDVDRLNDCGVSNPEDLHPCSLRPEFYKICDGSCDNGLTFSDSCTALNSDSPYRLSSEGSGELAESKTRSKSFTATKAKLARVLCKRSLKSKIRNISNIFS